MIEVTARRLHTYRKRWREGLGRPEALPVRARSAVQKAAAVLVLLLRREAGLHVLYTRRADHLSSHRGQVAFPGGRFDRRDPHLLAAALRETHEEVGIAPDQVEVLGSLEGRETR